MLSKDRSLTEAPNKRFKKPQAPEDEDLCGTVLGSPWSLGSGVSTFTHGVLEPPKR